VVFTSEAQIWCPGPHGVAVVFVETCARSDHPVARVDGEADCESDSRRSRDGRYVAFHSVATT
jgi:hypothetical protein